MKRKTFVKQLMALGVTRNQANEMCRRQLCARDCLRLLGVQKNTTWEYNLMMVCKWGDKGGYYCDGSPERAKRLYLDWLGKRVKANPIDTWKRNHPNNI